MAEQKLETVLAAEREAEAAVAAANQRGQQLADKANSDARDAIAEKKKAAYAMAEKTVAAAQAEAAQIEAQAQAQAQATTGAIESHAMQKSDAAVAAIIKELI